MIACVVHLYKQSQCCVPAPSLLSEHEARLDWIPFSPAVVCVYVLMFKVLIKKAGHEITGQWPG